MRHPDKAWADARYAEESLVKLREYYLEYLQGRAEPAAADTIRKDDYTTNANLLSGELHVRAKGGAIQLAYLSPRALKLLRRYLRERPTSAPTDRLWLSDDGRPLTYWGYQSVFRRLKRRSGVLRLRSHLLRHHFAQATLEKGAERAAVQEMLGHRTEEKPP